MKRLHVARLSIVAISISLLLTACTTSSLVPQYKSGDNKGYVSGDGQVEEYPVGSRGDAVNFEAKLTNGATKSAASYRGKVLVVNFWYASCPPCRAEAPSLEKLSQQSSSDTRFLGVNVRDGNDTIDAFTRSFHVTYDNASDADTGKIQLAFSGTRAPNSTPTTIVLDPSGRVSARVLGEVDPSTLKALIKTAASSLKS